MPKPVVSIVIAAYQAQRTLDEALTSVEAQTFTDWECLIVDDFSTDHTHDISKKWCDKDCRFRLITMPKNSGPSAARNRGLEISQGEWITILDSDDLFEKKRLSNLLRAAESLRVDVLFDNQWLFDDIEGTRQRWLPLNDDEIFRHAPERYLYQVCGLSRIHWGTAQPFFRRYLIENPALRYNEQIRYGEDVLWLSQIVHRAGVFGVCGATGYVYRIPRPGGASLSLSNTDGLFASRALVKSLDGITTRRGQLWSHLRVLNFKTGAWVANTRDALKGRDYRLFLKLIFSFPTAWGWLILRSLRPLFP